MSFSSIRSQLKSTTPKTKPTYVNLASLDIQFVKKHHNVEYDILSWNSRKLHVSRPDSIQFENIYNKEIQKKLTDKLESEFGIVYDHWKELQKEISRDRAIEYGQPYDQESKKNVNNKYYKNLYTFEINAEDAEKFLNILLAFKRESPTFSIFKTQYDKLLDDLVSHGYLTPKLKNHYLKVMPTDYLLSEREKFAEETKNFEEAITLAKVYNEKQQERSILYPPENSIYWLLEAQKYNPEKFGKLQKSLNMSEFFHFFTHIYSGSRLFTEEAMPILEVLKDIVTDLSFGCYFSPHYVNAYLSEFIQKSTTLKSLDISTTQTPDTFKYGYLKREKYLNSSHMHHIAKGLKVNTSLESLNIADQPIGDKGLCILLNALSSNPHAKLKSLNLFNTDITEDGLKALEKFLETNKTLQYISIAGGDRFLSKKIIQLIKRNQLAGEVPREAEQSVPMDVSVSPSVRMKR